MSEVVTKLGRLAASRGIAIVLLSQVTTRVRSDAGAFLHPAVSGTVWDSTIANRIVIFRDWLYQDQGDGTTERTKHVRFAGVTKAQGTAYEGAGKLAAFTIARVRFPHPTHSNLY